MGFTMAVVTTASLPPGGMQPKIISYNIPNSSLAAIILMNNAKSSVLRNFHNLNYF